MKKICIGGNMRVPERGEDFHHTNMQVYAC